MRRTIPAHCLCNDGGLGVANSSEQCRDGKVIIISHSLVSHFAPHSGILYLPLSRVQQQVVQSNPMMHKRWTPHMWAPRCDRIDMITRPQYTAGLIKARKKRDLLSFILYHHLHHARDCCDTSLFTTVFITQMRGLWAEVCVSRRRARTHGVSGHLLAAWSQERQPTRRKGDIFFPLFF